VETTPSTISTRKINRGSTDKEDVVDKIRGAFIHSGTSFGVFAALCILAGLGSPAESHAADATTIASQAITWQYHAKYFLAGAICASFSHAVAVPIDVIKTLKQTNSEFKSLDLRQAATKLISENGVAPFFGGLGPTLIGYSIQGGLKFGIYELLKPIIAADLLSAGFDENKLLCFLISGGLAELVGSTFLTPFEASRIRLVADPSFADGLFDSFSKMYDTEGMEGLMRGLPAIMAKSLPYTMVQLSSFEFITSLVYDSLRAQGFEDVGSYKLVISTGAAFVAAVLSSLASQPGDTMLSYVNKSSRKSTTVMSSEMTSGRTAMTLADRSKALSGSIANTIGIMRECIDEVGARGLYAGTQARLLHVTIIVVTQLVVYDSIKQLVGIPATGSH
jgi:solute carrier family 25 phosphate transporter 3